MTKISPDQLEFPFNDKFKERLKFNMLNSVLIEGNLDGDPLMLDEVCYFFVRHSSNNRNDIFRILTKDKLAKVCNDYLRCGRGVRVIGKLVRDADEVYISAEHVEFKPMVRNIET